MDKNNFLRKIKRLGIGHDGFRFTHANDRAAHALNAARKGNDLTGVILQMAQHLLNDRPIKDLIKEYSHLLQIGRGKQHELPNDFIDVIERVIDPARAAQQHMQENRYREEMEAIIAGYLGENDVGELAPKREYEGEAMYLIHRSHSALRTKVVEAKDLPKALEKFHAACMEFEKNYQELCGRGFGVRIPAETMGDIEILDGEKCLRKITCSADIGTINSNLRAALRKLGPSAKMPALHSADDLNGMISQAQEMLLASEPAYSVPEPASPPRLSDALAKVLEAAQLPLVDVNPFKQVRQVPVAPVKLDDLNDKVMELILAGSIAPVEPAICETKNETPEPLPSAIEITSLPKGDIPHVSGHMQGLDMAVPDVNGKQTHLDIVVSPVNEKPIDTSTPAIHEAIERHIVPVVQEVQHDTNGHAAREYHGNGHQHNGNGHAAKISGQKGIIISPKEGLSRAPVMLLFDTCSLLPLARRRVQDDPSSTLLPIIEMLSRLPNVVVAKTATVINLETCGAIEDWEGGQVKRQVVNRLFSSHISPRALAQAQDVKELMQPAYRIRRKSEGYGLQLIVTQENANPNLIIFETEQCREINYQLQVQDTLRGVTHHDVGEQTMERFLLQETPFDVPAIVISEDYGARERFRNKQTRTGQPIGTAKVADLIHAVYSHMPELFDRMHCNNAEHVLHVLGKMIAQGDPAGHSFTANQHRGRTADSQGETLGEVIARGVMLKKMEIECDSAIELAVEAERKREVSARLGGLIVEHMKMNKISYEQLAESINRVNRVNAEPKTPKIGVDDLKEIAAGWVCPDQDTHYALMDVLVMASKVHDTDTKKELIRELQDAWRLRQSVNPATPLEEAASLIQPYRYMMTALLEENGFKKTAGQLNTLGDQRIAIEKLTEHGHQWLASLIENGGLNKPVKLRQVINALAASGKILSDQEKLDLFGAMLDITGKNDDMHQRSAGR